MRLDELKIADNVILQVNINGQFADFPSTVIDVYDGEIIVEPVRVKDKVVAFNSDRVKLDLMGIRHDKAPIIWRGIRCATVLLKGNTYYKIKAFTEGVESNRRQAFRLYVGFGGVAQVGANKKPLEVIVKDVSETGFSFVAEQDYEESVNMPVRLVFKDVSNDRPQQFSLMGIVVRKVVVEENKIVYGCKLSVPNHELVRYINKKQREQLSNSKDRSVLGIAVSNVKEEERGVRRNEKKHQAYKMSALGSSERSIDDVDKEERRRTIRKMNSGFVINKER